MIKSLFWKSLLGITKTKELYQEIVDRPLSFSQEDRKLFQKKIDLLLESASKNVEFYKKRLPKNKKPTLKEFPLMTRPEFKRINELMLSDKYRNNLKKYNVKLNKSLAKNFKNLFFGDDFIFDMSTGGTSGSPLICHKNKETLFADALLFFKGWAMMGYKPGDKVLVFYDSYYNYDLSWFNWLTPLCGIKLFFFDHLSKEKIQELVKEINNFKPKIIVTFPSYINYAAEIVENENLKLTHFPEAIEVSGENLFKHQRENAERAFKSKVYDSYGSLEFGMVAHECEYQNGMHIYEDIAKIDSIKQNGQNIILATRYDTASWPVINYIIGDIGRVNEEKCKCGRNGLKLKEISGRIEDYVILPNKKRVYPTFFRQFIDFFNEKYENEIIESNLVQTSLKEINFNIVTRTQKHRKEIKKELLFEINKHLPKSMNLKINFPKDIPLQRKFRFIERKIV